MGSKREMAAEVRRGGSFLYAPWVCRWRHSDGCCADWKVARVLMTVVGALKGNKWLGKGRQNEPLWIKNSVCTREG